MNAFIDAIDNGNIEARTKNGMKARVNTGNACTDLFFSIGASRDKDITPKFVAALIENPELACRIALWGRDARGGAGERKAFRLIINYLSHTNTDLANRLVNKIPELGRWDDLFATGGFTRSHAFEMLKNALNSGNGLAAKWTPRKGTDAIDFRNYLKMSPKAYRKMLVGLTKVVETQMCAKEWGNINYSHVPSVAAARYQKAFRKHDGSRYAEYIEQLKAGTAKVNAAALYPYDVIRSMRNGDKDVAQAQWDSLPDYMDDDNILPVVDVSRSMTIPASGSITCIDVAVSLGLYLADKNKGVFKDTFVTFSSRPELLKLKGNLRQKLDQMERSKWEMSTNLHAVFDLVLNTAKNNNVPQEDMPSTIVIFSDMQFNLCVKHDDSAYEMINRKYKDAGYNIPRVVFWNLNAAFGNVPVSFRQDGTALVSGFSPSLMKSLLKDGEFTPEGIMLNTVNNQRYDF